MIPQVSRSEVLRYLGMHGAQPSDGMEQQIEQARAKMRELAQVKFVYKRFALERTEKGICVQGTTLILTGKDIGEHLKGCSHCVLMAVTLGMAVQRQIAAVQHRSMAQALYLDACATAAVEEACDFCEQELRRQYPEERFTSRFSPGYGDLPLSLQNDFLNALDARRRIGLFLTSSGLLTPCKSVTAVLGVGEQAAGKERSCEVCSLRETCTYRKRGTNCGHPASNQA